jgi:hypothetical protein
MLSVVGPKKSLYWVYSKTSKLAFQWHLDVLYKIAKFLSLGLLETTYRLSVDLVFEYSVTIL